MNLPLEAGEYGTLRAVVEEQLEKPDLPPTSRDDLNRILGKLDILWRQR